MTTKTDEQERRDFESFLSTLGLHLGNHERQIMFVAYQAGRAALQWQDRGDAVQKVIDKLSEMTPRMPKAITYDQGWRIIDVVQRHLCEAIDRARRIEGEAK